MTKVFLVGAPHMTLMPLWCNYLCFELIVEMWVIELDEAEEQGTFLGYRVIPWNLLFHVLLQERHVA